MPQYKLTYFGVRGLGEFIRYALAYGDKKTDWENVTVSFEEWPVMKPKTPFGQMPMLTLGDGRVLAQSRAILRFVAREKQLAPADSFHCAQADMLVDGVLGDVYPKYSPVYMSVINQQKPDETAALYAKFKQETLNQYLDIFEKHLNAQNSPWLVGGKLSYADLVVGEFLERMQTCFDPKVLDSHPKLAAHAKQVAALPGVKEYIAQRPKMAF